MKQLLLTFSLLLSSHLFCQSNYNSESYVVTSNDLKNNTFKKDSTANALVIYEYGNSYIDKNSFNLRTEFKHKVKILNRDGFNNATVSIYLYNKGKKKEKFKNLIASTYNVSDGKTISTKLESSSVFEEKYNENNTIIKFTMPNINEGSVITYSYEIESPFIYKYQEWEFQSDIPKLYSEYNTSIPAIYDYNIKLVGAKKLAKNEAVLKKHCLKSGNGASADCTNSIYVMKDIPAFIDEDYMTTRDNYLSRIEYELKVIKYFDGTVEDITKTWKTTDKELKVDPKIGKQLSKGVSSKSILDASITTESDPLIKAKAIFNFVKENYTWNKKHGLFGDSSVKNLLKNKSGSAAEINILLHNMLKENKIKVKPLLLSTRSNGLPTTIYPVISDFNYLIVQATINNTSYLLDGTDRHLTFGQIPFRCLNQYGRLLDFKEGSIWSEIKADNFSNVQYQIALEINDEHAVSGEINTNYTGYKALSKKRSYFPNPTGYVENQENNQQDINILDYTILSEDINSDTFEESIKIEIIDDNSVADKIYFDPFIYKFFKENPFKLQERSYPIDFGYKDTYVYALELDLGGKYVVEDKPKDINLRLPNTTGSAALSTTVIGNKLKLTFRIVFKEAIYGSNYYESLKKFMSKVVEIQNNSIIVLNKK